MRNTKRLLILLVCLLALCTTAFAAESTITDMKTDCAIDQSGVCQVTQTVTIEITGIETELVLPVAADAKAATVAGYKAKKITQDGYLLLALENPAGFSGSRTFTISYELDELVTENETEQLLTLPLLCPKWDFPIEQYVFTISLPAEFEAYPSFTSGYEAEVIEDHLLLTISGGIIRGTATTTLKDHESITMTLQLPAEYFTGTYSSWSANWVATVLVILLSAACVVYWALLLRSKRLRTSSRTLPPDSVLPCDLPYLLCLGKPDFNMLVCHWANLGYLTIHVNKQGDVQLKQRMQMGNERRALEAKLFATLFARGDVLDSASLLYKRTAKFAFGAIGSFWNRRIFRKDSGNPRILQILCCLCCCIAMLETMSLILPAMTLRWLILILFFLSGAVLSLCVQGIARAWYLGRIFRIALGGVCAVTMLVIAFSGGSPMSMLLSLGMSIFTGLAAVHGGKRTELGTQLISQALGFRRFVHRVSQNHVQSMLHRDPQYFYKMLPYVHAIGLGAQFCRKFSDLELEGCHWFSSEQTQDRTAAGFYAQLQQSLEMLELSIKA